MSALYTLARDLRSLSVDVSDVARVLAAVGPDARRWRGRAAVVARVEQGGHAAGLRSVVTALLAAADEVARAALALDAVGAVAPTVVGALGVLVAPTLTLTWTVHERAVRAEAADHAVSRCASALQVLADRCATVATAAHGPPIRSTGSWSVAADRANRHRLDRRLALWSARGQQEETSAAPAEVAAHLVDLRVVAAVREVHRDPVTGRPVPVLLLAYDPTAWSGRGRVVLAYGDPQRARDIAYVVPGLGSRADPWLGGLDDESWQLYDRVRAQEAQEAQEARRPRLTAVVAWLGYQTPDLPEVAFVERAERGATALAADIAALRRRRGEDQPHVTVVGHSYGSVVAGLATQRRPGDVDDVVGIGSPGMAAAHADELGVPTGHVWAGAASADLVTHLSRFGVDPAAGSFGGHRFPAEPSHLPPGIGVHSGYLAAGSQSLAAVADIVAGHGAQVSNAPGRTDHGYLGALLPFLVMSPWLAVPLSTELSGLPPTFDDPAAEG